MGYTENEQSCSQAFRHWVCSLRLALKVVRSFRITVVSASILRLSSSTKRL